MISSAPSCSFHFFGSFIVFIFYHSSKWNGKSHLNVFSPELLSHSFSLLYFVHLHIWGLSLRPFLDDLQHASCKLNLGQRHATNMFLQFLDMFLQFLDTRHPIPNFSISEKSLFKRDKNQIKWKTSWSRAFSISTPGCSAPFTMIPGDIRGHHGMPSD